MAEDLLGGKQDREASCRSVLEQTEFLLRDEISYSNTLRGSRNAVAGLLSLILGAGLFQIELRGPSEPVQVAPWAFWTIRLLLTAAIGLTCFGIYFLFTEQPGAKARQREEDEHPVLRPHRFQKGSASAALAVLHLRDDFRRRIEGMPTESAIKARTRMLSIAYERLARKNRRVRFRIEVARRFLFVALLLVLASFLSYLWGGLKGDPDVTDTQPAIGSVLAADG
ncbi:MAG: hypothetical protein AAFO89_10885 [Planctomycetota bacterium]